MLLKHSALAHLPAIAEPPEQQTDKPAAIDKKLDESNASLCHSPFPKLTDRLIHSSRPRSPNPCRLQHLHLLRLERLTFQRSIRQMPL